VEFQKTPILPAGEGAVRLKHFKKCIISRGAGGGVLEKISSIGEVWIFSVTTKKAI